MMDAASSHVWNLCIAVRDTSASRHHGIPVKGSHETPPTLRQYGTEGFKTSIIPREGGENNSSPTCTEETMLPSPFTLNGIWSWWHFNTNRKEKCHHDHIPFNVKGIGSIIFSVYQKHPTCEIRAFVNEIDASGVPSLQILTNQFVNLLQDYNQ